MPRTAIDYSKSQIYRIVCKNPKITDCFMTGTIPIYYGIDNIGDYFNTDGIIRLTDDFKVEDLSFDLYHSKLDAIKDNFERGLNILLSEDFIYINFIKNK